MKNLLLGLFILSCLISCNLQQDENPDGYDEFRKIAWNELDCENDSNYLAGSYKEGIVSESTNPDTNLDIIFIRFKHKFENLNGPYGVGIDPNSKEVVYIPIGE